MNCPGCKEGKLLDGFLEPFFRCKTCDHCQGNWILLDDYLNWKENSCDEHVENSIDFEPLETKRVLICPVTGNFMLKYRISNKIDHRIDLSPAINAIWLDRGEWQLLKYEGLSRCLNSITTPIWQAKIRKNQTRETLEQLYIKELGEQDYAKIEEIRSWISAHPKRQRILAFLKIADPWSV